MSHIFISYSQKDIKAAQTIVDALSANNLDTWIDWKSIPPSVGWEKEIHRGIEQADAFLFLISPDSSHSAMCNEEIAHAVENGKRIITILIRNTDAARIPSDVAKIQWIRCRDGYDDFNKAINDTHKAIRTDYEWLEFHTRLQVSSLEWKRHDDESFLLRGKELQDAEKQFGLAGKAKDPQPTDLQRQFIVESRTVEDRRKARELQQAQKLVEEQKKRAAEKEISATHNRNLAYLMTGIAIIAIVFLAASIWLGGQVSTALYNEQKANSTAQADRVRAEEQASVALARQLAAESLSLADKNPVVAALLASEAKNVSPIKESQIALGRTLLYQSWLVEKSITIPSSYVSKISWSPDKRKIAYIAGNRIYVWNIESDDVITIRWNDGTLHDYSWNPDGEFLVAVGDRTIRIFDANTGKVVKTKRFSTSDFAFQQLEGVSWSSDGNYLLIGTSSDFFYLFDSSRLSQVTGEIISASPRTEIKWSLNGRWIAVQTNQGLRIGNLAYFLNDYRHAKSYTFNVSGFSWSPINEDVIALVTSDKVRIMNLAHPEKDSVQETTVFIAPETWVLTGIVELNSLDETVAVSFDDQSNLSIQSNIAIIDLNTGNLKTILHGGNHITGFSWSPDGKGLALSLVSEDWSSESFLYVWNTGTAVEYLDDTTLLSVKIDSERFMKEESDESAQSFEFSANDVANHISEDDRFGKLTSWFWDNTNERLITIHDNKLESGGMVLSVWDSETKESLYQAASTGEIKFVISPDHRYFVAISYTDNIDVVRMQTGEVQFTLATNSWGDIIWNPNSNLLFADIQPNESSLELEALGRKYNRDEVWDVTLKTKLFSLENHGYPAWNPNGSQLAYLLDEDVAIYDAQSGQELAYLPDSFPIFSGDLTGWSPDGKKFVAQSTRTGIDLAVIWETDTWTELITLSPEAGIDKFDWSPLGTWGILETGNQVILINNQFLDDPCNWLPRNLTRKEWNHYVGEHIPYRATCPKLPVPTE